MYDNKRTKTLTSINSFMFIDIVRTPDVIEIKRANTQVLSIHRSFYRVSLCLIKAINFLSVLTIVTA